jgi:hypothetical protein
VSDDRLELVLGYLAEDLHEQGLSAHINGKAEASDALMGVSAAIRRAAIDVMEVEVPRKKRGLLARLGIAR